MEKQASASSIKAIGGRITSAMFLSGFGALWLLAARYFSRQMSAAFFIGTALATAAVWLVATIIRRSLPRVEKSAATIEGEQRSRKIFRQINMAQWGAIVLAVIACNIARGLC